MQTDPYAAHWPEESDFPFTTDNLVLARLLLAHGHEPQIEDSRKGRAIFSFPHSNEVGQIVQGYHYGVAIVDPDEYERARTTLRRLMNDARSQGQ
jgi:hypothetical protein